MRAAPPSMYRPCHRVELTEDILARRTFAGDNCQESMGLPLMGGLRYEQEQFPSRVAQKPLLVEQESVFVAPLCVQSVAGQRGLIRLRCLVHLPEQPAGHCSRVE